MENNGIDRRRQNTIYFFFTVTGKIYNGVKNATPRRPRATFDRLEQCALWSYNAPWTSLKSGFNLKIITPFQKVTLPGKSTKLLSRRRI